MDEEFFTVQTYTPGSDLAVGFNPNQIILGRSGNDTDLGYQPIEDSPDRVLIDVLIGDLALDDPAFRSWNDTFILGDWSRPYYDDGDPSIFGLNDFGFIGDFDPVQDTIQLHGSPEDYQLLDVGIGTAILLQQDAFDVVGFVLGGFNLDLESDDFQFEGSTPPPGPVIPQAQQLGTLGFEISTSTSADPFGDVYIAGGTTGSLAGENSGLRDVLVAKYDGQGELINTIQFGTEDFDTAYGIATDEQGNFYIAGTTEGDLAAPLQTATSDIIIAKYNRDGDRQWIEQLGFEGDLINQGLSIDADAEGNAYVSGIRVKPSPDLATDDFFVTKYDTNGNQEWFTEVGTDDIPGTIEDFDESYGVAVSDDGNVYATGWTLSDLAAENAGLYDAWIGQFDGDDGELNWLRQFGTPDYEWSWAVDTDSEGNAYATGWTLGDLGGENAGIYDAWLAKYDEQGNQEWLRQFGTPGDDEAFGINIDSDDNIFVTGYTNSDLGGENAGSFDAWVAQYDTDGNQVGIDQFGTPNFDQGYGITSNSDGDVYFTGVTDGSFGDTNAGSFDALLSSLDSEPGSLDSDLSEEDVDPSELGLPIPFGDLPVEPQTTDFMNDYFQELTSSGDIADPQTIV